MGSVIALTDSNGIVTDEYEYDEYGSITQTKSTSYNPYKYIGQQYDEVTGLIYLRARYYESQTGRFVSRDPIGIKGGMNEYGYTNNNPIIFTDNNGLQSRDEKGDLNWIKLSFQRTLGSIKDLEKVLPPTDRPWCSNVADIYYWLFKEVFEVRGNTSQSKYHNAVLVGFLGIGDIGHVAYALMKCPNSPPNKNNIDIVLDYASGQSFSSLFDWLNFYEVVIGIASGPLGFIGTTIVTHSLQYRVEYEFGTINYDISFIKSQLLPY